MSKRFERIAQTVFTGLLLVSPMALTAHANQNGNGQSVKDTVEAGKHIVFKVTLVGGQRNTIELRGDGAADIDLYVYDMDGKLLINDTRYLDGASVWFEVAQDVTVQVVVANNGEKSSEFELRLETSESQTKPQPQPEPMPKPMPKPEPKPEPTPDPMPMPRPMPR